MREAYVQHGVAEWYAQSGARYRNPHEPGVREAIFALIDRLPAGRVLDLACGSGEVTLALRAGGVDPSAIDGCDPFTASAYRERTGVEAHAWRFEDLADGLPEPYSVVICSFALHLCPASWLPRLVQSIARSSQALLVLTPHKRPELRQSWGMRLEEERYFLPSRVRARLYRSERVA